MIATGRVTLSLLHLNNSIKFALSPLIIDCSTSLFFVFASAIGCSWQFFFSIQKNRNSNGRRINMSSWEQFTSTYCIWWCIFIAHCVYPPNFFLLNCLFFFFSEYVHYYMHTTCVAVFFPFNLCAFFALNACCLRFWHCFVSCLGSAFLRDARQIRRIVFTFDLVVLIDFWFLVSFRILPTIQTCYLHLNMTNCFLMQENKRKQEQNKRNFWFNRDFSNLSLFAQKAHTHTHVLINFAILIARTENFFSKWIS